MGTKDNFVKALKELTGFDEEDNEKKYQKVPQTKASGKDSIINANVNTIKKNENLEEISQARLVAKAPSRVVSKAEPKPVVAEMNLQLDLKSRMNKEMKMEEAVAITRPSENTSSDYMNNEYTRITENMVVIGNISSKDKIELQGKVRGDVDTQEDVIILGIVEGGVKGNNMLLQGSSVKGNILSDGDISIKKGSAIVGNVQGINVNLDGKVKGNLFVSNMTQLSSNALLIGDIETSGIATSIGSRIRGSIITKRQDDIDEDIDFDLEV